MCELVLLWTQSNNLHHFPLLSTSSLISPASLRLNNHILHYVIKRCPTIGIYEPRLDLQPHQTFLPALFLSLYFPPILFLLYVSCLLDAGQRHHYSFSTGPSTQTLLLPPFSPLVLPYPQQNLFLLCFSLHVDSSHRSSPFSLWLVSSSLWYNP